MLKFDNKTIELSKLEVELSDTLPENGGDTTVYHGGKYISGVIVDGEKVEPSDRFWSSLYSRYGINNSIFKFFSHDEIFKRISEKERDDRLRVTIERDKETGDGRLLAAVAPTKPVVIYDDFMELLDQYGASKGVEYCDGIVTSIHTPRVAGVRDTKIAGDSFKHQLRLMTPIDGYGKTNMFLALLRQVCSNGMVGMAERFRTTLSLGKEDNLMFTLRRAIENFNNEEGYAILRDRFDVASRSWSSLQEHQDLYRLLLSVQNDEKMKKSGKHSDMMKDYREITGDVEAKYFGANTFSSPRKMRILPTAAKVYELMNFATEVATHNVTERAARRLNAWVGTMLSSEYDLEESCDQFDDWRTMFVTENMKERDKQLWQNQ